MSFGALVKRPRPEPFFFPLHLFFAHPPFFLLSLLPFFLRATTGRKWDVGVTFSFERRSRKPVSCCSSLFAPPLQFLLFFSSLEKAPRRLRSRMKAFAQLPPFFSSFPFPCFLTTLLFSLGQPTRQVSFSAFGLREK